jgi:hypothetical protein
MCEKRRQGNIFHKVNKISRVVCGLFIKFACVHKAVAFRTYIAQISAVSHVFFAKRKMGAIIAV